MNLKSNFLIMIFLIFSLNSYSQDCNKADVYKDFDKAIKTGVVQNYINNGKSLSPTRNQGSMGFCYAYAGSDMLESWLKKTGQMPVNENVSAIALGLNYSKDNWAEKNGYFNGIANKRMKVLPFAEKINQKNIELENEIKDLRGKKTIFGNAGVKLTLAEMRGEIDKEKLKIAKSELDRRSLENDNEIIKRQKEIESNKLSLAKVIDKLNELEESNPYKMGGQTIYAINRSWPKICFESEVSSRNDAIASTYRKNRSFYDSLHMKKKPDSFRSLLPVIGELQFNPGLLQCRGADIINSAFPGVGLMGDKSMYDLVKGLGAEESVFERILKESCRSKTFRVTPDVRHLYANSTPRSSTEVDNVMKILDVVLDDGKTAAISISADILKNESFQPSESNHVVLMAGKMNVCGEKYYIIRNSWGESACSSDYLRIKSDKSKDVLDGEKRLDGLNDNGKKKIMLLADEKFPNCGSDVKCIEAREKLISDNVNKLEALVKEKKEGLYQKPFFCDSSGNYVMKESFLKKGFFGADIIRN